MEITKDVQDPTAAILAATKESAPDPTTVPDVAMEDVLPAPTTEPEAPVAETPETPTEEASDTAKIAEDLRGGEKVTTEEEPVAETKDVDVKDVEKGNDVIIDWDSDSSETTNEQKSDYSEISSFLGIEGNTKESISDAFNQLKTEVAELKTGKNAKDGYANDLIREANEIAGKGGDWQEYLGVATSSLEGVSDRDLVKQQVTSLMGKDAKIEDINEYLDGLTDGDMLIKAGEIRQRHDQNKQYLANDLKRQAEEKRQTVNNGLKEALSNVTDIAGFQPKDSHKQKIYDDLTSEQGFSEMFLDDKGNYDFSKIVRNKFVLDNFDNIVGYLKNNGVNNGKRSVIDNLSNVDLGNNNQSQEINNPEKEEVAPAISLIQAMKAGKNPLMGN